MKRITPKCEQTLAPETCFEHLVIVRFPFPSALTITDTFLPQLECLILSEHPSKRRKVASVENGMTEHFGPDDPQAVYDSVNFHQDFGAPTRKHQTMFKQVYLD